MNLLRWFAAVSVLMVCSTISAQTYPLGQQNPATAGFQALGVLPGYNAAWEFQVNAPGVQVTHLACNMPMTNATTVTLFDTTTMAKIAQAPAPVGSGWRTMQLTTPVSLVNGRRYRVAVMLDTAGYYYLLPAPASWLPTGIIQYTDYYTTAGVGTADTYPNNLEINGIQAGIPDIGFVTGPQLSVSATAGTAQTVFANEQGTGGNGLQSGTFSISSNGQTPNSTMTGIDITASGSGNDAAAFSEVRIYRDNPAGTNPGVFDPADIPVAGPSVFTANDGTINFSVATAEQGFALNETRNYFVVTKLASAAFPGDAFQFTVSDITVATGNKSVPANSTMNGLVIDTPQFVITDASSQSVQMAVLGARAVCQEFTIAYPNGPDNKPASISINGLGTADEVADLTAVELWWDSDTNGTFAAGSDTLIDSQTFAQDNGSVAFSLGTMSDFQEGQTHTFFVVYNLNTSGTNLETFKCYVTDIGSAALGGTPTGLPAPSANGTPGLEVSASALIATINGPLAATMVNNNTQGAIGDGELLCDLTLSATAVGNWNVASLTFVGSGTGAQNSAFSELALYEDDSSGTWDGAAVDSLAAPTSAGYSAGSVTFSPTQTTFTAGTSRRFFLVGKMNGTATVGQTFNARLESAATTPPANGITVGIPTADTTALVIDVAVLTVANAATQPSPTTHKAGTAATYTIAALLLTTVNDTVTVNGINFTTAGSGDWTSDVDGTTGLQVYQDDGDGVFNAADTLLYQGAGAAVVTTTFTTPLIMPVTSSATLWVRLNLTATAGMGRVATPETFTLSVAAGTDVNATIPATLGTPPPTSIAIGAIEFEVSSFAPKNDLPAGGKSVSMSGKGFMSPLTVTIDGVVCPGTPNITGGTQLSGLLVPPGGGQGLTIVVNSGTLPPQTLTQTFSYSKVSNVDSGGDSGGGGCAIGTGNFWALLAGLVAAFALVRRTRRTDA